MKNYISFFEPGGTVVPDKYFIELKDWKGNSTGHKMIKNPVFIVKEDLKDLIQKIGNNLKQYNGIKKNLPEINQNTSSNFSPSIGTTISLADYWSKNNINPFSFSSNSNTSSGI